MCLLGLEASSEILSDAYGESSRSRHWVTVPPISSPTHLLKGPLGIQLAKPQSYHSRSTLGLPVLQTPVASPNETAENMSHKYSRKILGTRWALLSAL